MFPLKMFVFFALAYGNQFYTYSKHFLFYVLDTLYKKECNIKLGVKMIAVKLTMQPFIAVSLFLSEGVFITCTNSFILFYKNIDNAV